MTRRKTTWLGAVCAVLVAAALFVWLRDPHTAREASLEPAPVTTIAEPPALTPEAEADPVTAVPHDDVAPAAPTRFTLTGKKFTIRADVCTMANVRPYDPPGDEHHTVCWVRGAFGDAPGSDHETSYLFGHSWAPDPDEVLNKASAAATAEFLRVKHARGGVRLPSVTPSARYVPLQVTTPVYPIHVLDGYRVVLETPNGTLTYRVRSTYIVRKILLGDVKAWENTTVRNRVVITTCAELNGVDYDYNVIINAYLERSVSRSAHRG